MTNLYTCRICGASFGDAKYIDGTHLDMHKHRMCFECNFWREIIDERANQPWYRSIRINGAHYATTRPYIVNDGYSKHTRGFGGSTFYIQHESGDVIQTNDLMGQSKIPEAFRDQLPDNARFLTRDEFEALNNE